MPTWSVTIGGVERDCRIGSLNIQEVANGVNTMRASFVSEAGVFRPALGAEIIITRDGVRQFGGYINKTAETGIDKKPLADIETLVDADSFNIIAERRFVYEVIAAGSTLKQALEQIEPHITPYGASLSGSQANGPALVSDVEFAGETFLEAISRLSQLTGFVGGIDYNKSLRMVEFGEVAAPFDVIDGDGNHVGDVEVQRSRGKYFNRVVVKYGDGIVDRTDTFVGDGAEDNFELTYRMIYSPTVGYGYVWNDDDPANPGQPQYETLDLAGQGASWSYDPTTNSITRDAGAPANLNDISITYPAQFPAIVVVEDAAEIIANGLFETVVSYPTVFDKAEATALGESHLSQFLAILQTVKFDTFETGLHPGQTITLTIADRNVSGDHFISEVKPFNPQNMQDLRWSVTAIDSETFRGTFRQLYRDWLGGGTKNANVGPPASSGGSGAAPPNRSIQVNREGRFYGSNELLHDWGNDGEEFGVEELQSALASVPEDESRLSFAFGNRDAGLDKALTGWQLSDGTFYIEHDAAADLLIYKFGLGSVDISGPSARVQGGEPSLAGSHLRLGDIIATDSSFPGVQRKTTSFTLNTAWAGGGLPEHVVILDSSTARVVTLPAVTDDFISLGAVDSWSRQVTFINIGTAAWSLTPASGTIEGASTFLVSPGQRVTAQAFAGTGAGWFICSSHSGGILSRSVTLTDAQVKALPTTGITIVAAPGADYWVKVIAASLSIRSGGGAYTNINATYSSLQVQTVGGSWRATAIVNDSAFTTDLAKLTYFLGNAHEVTAELACPYVEATADAATSGTQEWITTLVSTASASLEDLAVEIKADNNGSGNFTGGHSSGILKVTLYYAIEAL